MEALDERADRGDHQALLSRQPQTLNLLAVWHLPVYAQTCCVVTWAQPTWQVRLSDKCQGAILALTAGGARRTYLILAPGRIDSRADNLISH